MASIDDAGRGGLDDLLRELVAVCRDSRDELRLIRVALDARHGPRDAADRQVLSAIGASMGKREFNGEKLLARAREESEAALADALTGADIETGRELGKLLARLEGVAIDGLQLERVGTSRAGIIWCVRPQV